MKRLFDVCAAFAALLLLWPLLLVLVAVVKCTSPGPVFFGHERVGLGGRRFLVLKFRTMVPDAARLGGPITIGVDPRITRIGRFLRSTKLDELPQLTNVLRGDMSFVGPRPEAVHYVELFRDDYQEILKVRPGITDLASLKYRDESTLLGQAEDPELEYTARILPEKIRLAKEYIRRRSLWFDLCLIVRTVAVLVTDRLGRRRAVEE